MRRAGWWSLFGLLAVFILLDALVVIGAVVDTHTRDDGLAAGLVSIGFLLLLGVGMVAAARSVAHRLSRHHPRQKAPQAVKRDRSPSVGKFGIVIFVTVMAAMAVFVPNWLTQVWPTWRTSVETQDHGLGSTLTVQRVIRVAHSTRGGNYYTAQLQGELVPPVDGRTETTVYTPSEDAFSEQEKIPVLVDPQNLAYAEQPGLENYSFAGVIGIVFLMLATYLALFAGIFRLVGRWRSHLRSRKDRASLWIPEP